MKAIIGTLVCAALLIFSLGIHAQERVMLVLDASGSMWGQIEGVTKIEIARDALKTLVKNWGDDREVGLVVYGHRRKGDCQDIEVLVPVGPLDAARMVSLVDRINPKGKTPLSASVEVAAEALKFTEEKATVVLISDGKETCSMDPCALGTRLEKLGVDFTAHVIGFDVQKIEDQAGLRCLAENTGGRFITADNAAEMNQALEQTAMQPEPEPEPVPVIEPEPEPVPEPEPSGEIQAPEQATKGTRFEVTLEGEPGLQGGYLHLYAKGAERSLTYERVKEKNGAYQPIVLRMAGVAGDYELRWLAADHRVVASHPMVAVEAEIRLEAPQRAVQGTKIGIDIDAPSGLGGYLYLYAKGRTKSLDRVPAREAKQGGYQRATLRLPAVSGDYVIKWLSPDNQVYAEAEVLAEEAAIDLGSPAEAPAGTKISFQPEAPPGLDGQVYVFARGKKLPMYGYVRVGKTSNYQPVSISLPAQPGDYELRWLSARSEVLASAPLRLVAADISLDAPDEAAIGTTIQVALNAPDGVDGQVKLFMAGRDRSIAYGYAREAKQGGYQPVALRLPATPGEYLLRWFSGRNELLAERPISVVPADIKLVVAAEAPIASAFEVGFEAPAGLGGQLRLFVPGRKKYLSYGYVREGQMEDYQATQMRLPATPGDYLLRWVSPGKETLAEATIRAVAADLALDGPDEVVAGERFDVTISAPDGLAGRVHVIAPDSGKSLSSRAVQTGALTAYAPVTLKAPKQPGEYLIRWITKKKEPLAERSLTVTE